MLEKLDFYIHKICILLAPTEQQDIKDNVAMVKSLIHVERYDDAIALLCEIKQHLQTLQLLENQNVQNVIDETVDDLRRIYSTEDSGCTYCYDSE